MLTKIFITQIYIVHINPLSPDMCLKGNATPFWLFPEQQPKNSSSILQACWLSGSKNTGQRTEVCCLLHCDLHYETAWLSVSLQKLGSIYSKVFSLCSHCFLQRGSRDKVNTLTLHKVSLTKRTVQRETWVYVLVKNNKCVSSHSENNISSVSLEQEGRQSWQRTKPEPRLKELVMVSKQIQ